MYSNSSLNRSLKHRQEICSIGRKLVFMQPVHTYATEITLSHGTLESTSKMFGLIRDQIHTAHEAADNKKMIQIQKALDKIIAKAVFCSYLIMAKIGL